MSEGSQPNPYAAPAAPGKSHRAGFERKLLEFYWRYNERPPTLFGLLLRHLPSWCLLAVVMLSATAVFAVIVGIMFSAFLGAFLVGMLCGAIARDFGISWRFVRAWPLIRQLLNWEKISGLLHAGATGARVD